MQRNSGSDWRPGQEEGEDTYSGCDPSSAQQPDHNDDSGCYYEIGHGCNEKHRECNIGRIDMTSESSKKGEGIQHERCYAASSSDNGFNYWKKHYMCIWIK